MLVLILGLFFPASSLLLLTCFSFYFLLLFILQWMEEDGCARNLHISLRWEGHVIWIWQCTRHWVCFAVCFDPFSFACAYLLFLFDTFSFIVWNSFVLYIRDNLVQLLFNGSKEGNITVLETLWLSWEWVTFASNMCCSLVIPFSFLVFTFFGLCSCA